MPVAAIDNEGATMYYEDSGIPPNSTDYTTVVFNHGYVVHAAIFRPLFKYAAAHNLRLIAANQREYPGSSLLSDAQLAQFHSTEDEDQEAFVIDHSKDLARFLSWLITHENIPPPSKTPDGKKKGGLSIFSWSAGNTVLFGMLANLSSFDESLQNHVESYLTSIISYDPPCVVLGITDPPKTYSPTRDYKTPPDKLTEAFLIWAAGWYAPYPDLESVTSSSVINQQKFTTDPSHPRYLSTYEAMTQEEQDATTFPDIAARFGPGFVSWEIYANNVRRGVFDTQGVLKHVPLHLLWAANSPWNCPWSAKTIKDRLDEPPAPGEVRRVVHIERLEDMNHFGHHDQPERMTRIIAEHVSSP